jgi:L-threonylcarbamoyladenylate synthase
MYLKVINLIKNGKVGVLATDTIYGVVAEALDKSAVEKLYKIKGRSPSKPFIILISDISQLSLFGITLNNFAKKQINNYWPGPVSIILDCHDNNLDYLHRGKNSLAFRMPNKRRLLNLIDNTGPLVAPSANPEGFEPAKDIDQARQYFGESIDFYIDEGAITSNPSKIIKISNNFMTVLRNN